jgi:hypothetical protein
MSLSQQSWKKHAACHSWTGESSCFARCIEKFLSYDLPACEELEQSELEEARSLPFLDG